MPDPIETTVAEPGQSPSPEMGGLESPAGGETPPSDPNQTPGSAIPGQNAQPPSPGTGSTPANGARPGQTPQGQTPQHVSLEQHVRQRQRAREAETRYQEAERKIQELQSTLERYRPLVEQTEAAQRAGQPLNPQQGQVLQLQDTVRRMQEMIEETNTSMVQAQIESQMRVLQKDYPMMRPVEVLQQYARNPDIPLDELARVSHDEMKALRDAAVKEYVDSKTRRNPQPPRGGGAPTATPPKQFKSIEEAASAAAEHLRRLEEQ